MVLATLNTVENLTLPLEIKKLVKLNKRCRLIRYSKYMKRHGLEYNEMLEFGGTDDAFTDYLVPEDKYIIFYNDLDEKKMNSFRYRWNIAHELGHVVLEHHKNNNKTRLFRNTLSKNEYAELEEEADQFAAYLLVPYAVLEHYSIDSGTSLGKICKISGQASQYRFNEYIKWKANNFRLDQYDFYIRKLFYRSIYQKYCNNCGHYFIHETATCCPVCGGRFLERKYSDMIYNDLIQINKKGQAQSCPKCGNENIHSDSSYCHICGAYVIQKCLGEIEPFDNVNLKEQEGCGCNDIPGNARYCPKCSSITSFYFQSFLSSWEDEINMINELTAIENETSIEQTNFDDDDDIPF